MPFADVQQLIAFAKTRPGRLNFATSGTGSGAHLNGELLNSMARIKMVHVPYKSISYVKSEIARWIKVARDAGIAPE